MMRLFFFILLCLFYGACLAEGKTDCTQNDIGTNQVMYYLLYHPGNDDWSYQYLSYCASFDDNLQGPTCDVLRLQMLYMSTLFGYPRLSNVLLMNMDFGVLKEASLLYREIDMHHLGTPIAYMSVDFEYKPGTIEFHLFKSHVVTDDIDDDHQHQYCAFYHGGCRFLDGRLRSPRGPLDLVYLNMALYVNEYHARNAYFFVKKGSKVAAYPIDFSILLEGRRVYANEKWLTLDWPKFNYTNVDDMSLIQNFPQENYQEYFFAFDSHYGCFALLYWEGSRSHTPEVHYYYFDEDHPNDEVKLVDKIILHGFDFYEMFDRSTRYYDSILNFPVFKSFGRQIFIGLQKIPGGDYLRYRIWTPNEEETRSSDDCNAEPYVDNQLHHSYRKRIFLIDGRWIRNEKAQTVHPTTTAETTATTTLPSTAEPTNILTTTAAPPTTVAPPATTSTSANPTTSTQKPTTITPKSNTLKPITTTTTKSSTSTSTSPNGPGAETSSFSCSIPLWGLLLVILFDLILIIVLIVITVLIFKGKKKMKAAEKRMSKKSIKKSGRKRRGAAIPKKDTESGNVVAEMGNEKPSKESAMKNKKDKAGDSKKKKNASKKSSKKDGKKKGAGDGAPKKNASVKRKKNKK